MLPIVRYRCRILIIIFWRYLLYISLWTNPISDWNFHGGTWNRCRYVHYGAIGILQRRWETEERECEREVSRMTCTISKKPNLLLQIALSNNGLYPFFLADSAIFWQFSPLMKPSPLYTYHNDTQVIHKSVL